jgi:hypothetical protein
MRSPTPIPALLLTLALVACNAAPAVPTAPAVESAAAATPTTPPTATPEPTLDHASVAAAYLAMSTKLIAANQAAVAGLNIATSNAEASAAYQLFVDGDDVAITAVKAIEFPPDLQDEAAAFVAALEKHKAAMARLVANPQDTDPTIDQMLNEAAAESRAAATAIRAALGLPPPATPAPTAT